MRFYVYGLADPRTNVIRYVGKGQRNRMFQHIKLAKGNKIDSNNFTKFNGLKEILDSGYSDVIYHKLFETDNEKEAYDKELELIEQYDTLYPNGWNLVLGTGGMSGELHPNFGKIWSLEIRQKMSKAHTNEVKQRLIQSRQGSKCGGWNKGLSHSNETKSKISKTKQGRKASKETKLKMSLSAKKAWEKRK